jgi:hypothetical protein
MFAGFLCIRRLAHFEQLLTLRSGQMSRLSTRSAYWHVHDAPRVHMAPVLDAVLLPVLQEGLAFPGQLISQPRQPPETGAEQ